jgi:hypothetical protein
MHATPLFETMLQGLPHADITLPFADCGQGYARTQHYQFRYDRDKVEIGLAGRFDRWANSVDFLCQPVPDRQDVFEALMTVLERARKEGWGSPVEFTPLDLWPHVRKARRDAASATRLAARQALKAQRLLA